MKKKTFSTDKRVVTQAPCLGRCTKRITQYLRYTHSDIPREISNISVK